MNDTTKAAAKEEEGPRRSERQRRPAESIYADAKLAERKKREAMNDKKKSERSIRYKKRKKGTEEEDSEEENDEDSTVFSDDEMEQIPSDCEEEKDGEDKEKEEDRSRTTTKPSIIGSYQWGSRPLDSFSGEGSLFYTNWYGNRYLSGEVGCALYDAQRSLTTDQDRTSIALEYNSAYLCQVPYHADMMPCYDYFAEGIQRRTSLKEFKIINYNLPQSPWLATNILPVLEQNPKLTVLEIANCSLSADDLTPLVKFISENKTLSTLNISHTTIESEDTVKALAKALKKHPSLRSVNLAYCKLAASQGTMKKVLAALKKCDTLEIGHKDFDSQCVEEIATFLGKKHSLSSFSLVEAPVNKDNKKLLSEALTVNKTIRKIRLHGNALKLPAIIRNTKMATKSLSRLTHLDVRFNSFPVTGAKSMARFLENPGCSLVSLIMSNNHFTSKGLNSLLPALKVNTSLQILDLSSNWINDNCAPAVINMLLNNTTLLSLDLSKNKSLKVRHRVRGQRRRRRRRWHRHNNDDEDSEEPEPAPRDGGKVKIVKGALFDLSSMESIAACNHTCAVKMSGSNLGNSHEETIRKINLLDISDAKKIRHKVVLALNKVKPDLYESCNFKDLPLEMMPYLLEMLQQRLSPTGFPGSLKRRGDKTSLTRLYDAIKTWQTLPLLFARGPGKRRKKVAKKKSNPRKRRKFGEETDDEDEAWIPKGARTTGKYQRNPETGKYEWIPPPVY